uniref:Uncharacterized protein n=1 Tax=Triticum urartu TaxID=4572 RepID=A0A8R7PK10_TRIUA
GSAAASSLLQKDVSEVDDGAGALRLRMESGNPEKANVVVDEYVDIEDETADLPISGRREWC